MLNASAALAGLLFGLGLILSGMTDPAKVLGFLDLAGSWDPSLALVMGGAVAVGAGAFALAKRRRRSWLGQAMQLPAATRIDRRRRLGSGRLLPGTGARERGRRQCAGADLRGGHAGRDARIQSGRGPPPQALERYWHGTCTRLRGVEAFTVSP